MKEGLSRMSPLRALLLAVALLVSACATPTRVNSIADMSETQPATVRAYFEAMTQRDEIYESASGLKRGDSNFLAVKDSVGALYRDPVVQDWMLVQRANDRDGFARAWMATFREGVMRVDDVGGLLMLRALGASMARLDDAQCKEVETAQKSDRDNKGFNVFLKYMSDGEVREFFGGVRKMMVAGITRAPLRPVPTSAQIVAATNRADALLPKRPAGTTVNSCQRGGEAFAALEGLQGADRTNLLTAMLAIVSVGAGNVR
jgi:hypothetical protein